MADKTVVTCNGVIDFPSMNVITGKAGTGAFTTNKGIASPLNSSCERATVNVLRPARSRLDANGVEIELKALRLAGSETHVIAPAGQSEDQWRFPKARR